MCSHLVGLVIFFESPAVIYFKIRNANEFHVMLKALEKLKRQLAEAEAELESRKKPSEDTGPKFVGEGLVIDEWVNFLLIHSCVHSAIFDWSLSPSSSIHVYRKKDEKDTWLDNRWKG